MRPPSVDALARSLVQTGLPHPLLVDVARAAIAAGEPESATELADQLRRTLLQPVINATGVMLHTNLGRAPIAHSQTARFSNLELDLNTGQRGSRNDHVAMLAAKASGAEAALIVNNGAAAVLLALTALAKGRSVVVSRGELVEIGGGFRVPDVMASSGAHLLEVGTTNRTHPRDYENACVGHDVAMLLKVHPSNYQITGFTSEVSVETLAAMGKAPVVVDLGSGLLDEKCGWLRDGPPKWLRNEPAVRQTLQEGADLVTYSGDKLLGGAQAGIMVGSRDIIERCGRHPLARALRPGGLVLASLQETLLAYLNGTAGEIPLWAFAAATRASLRERAEGLGAGEVCDTVATMGGGSIPGSEIPSAGVRVSGDQRTELRAADLPIMARMDGDATVIDLRAVKPEDDHVIGAALKSLPTP